MNRFKILFLAFFVSGCTVSHNVMVCGKLQNAQVLSTGASGLVGLTAKPLSVGNKQEPIGLHSNSLDCRSTRHIRDKSLKSKAYLTNCLVSTVFKTKSDSVKSGGSIKPAKIKRKNHDFWWQFAMVLWLNINLITFFLASLAPGLSIGAISFFIFFLAFFFLMLSFDSIINYTNKLKQTPWELKKVSHNVLKASKVSSIITAALFILLAFVAPDFALTVFGALLLTIASTLILSQIFLVPKRFDYHKMLNRDSDFLEWNRNRIIKLTGSIVAIFSGITALSILSLGSGEGFIPIPAFFTSLSMFFIWIIPIGLLLLAYGTWLSVRKPRNPEKLEKYPAFKWGRRLFWIGFFSLIFFAIILWLSFALYSFPDLFVFYPSPVYYLAIALGIAPIFLWITALILLIISAAEIRRASKPDNLKGH